MYNTVIIGGGPAGCSAAITLAQRGHKVAVIEAKAYPHHKVCGEFLSPECTHLLDQLGLLPALYALHPTCITTACITAPDGTCWETRLPGTALGITRHALDSIMAHHARSCGVQIIEETTATGIDGSFQDGFTIHTRTKYGESTVTAPTVIAAHGKRSNLDKALKRSFLNTAQPYVGLKAHFEGLPLPDRIELHAFPGGYCGMSEVEGGLTNVCLLAHRSLLQAHKQIDHFIGWMKRQNPYLTQRLADSICVSDRWLSISEVPFTPKPPVERGILMVGDAAGLIAPLAGDGIAIALHSGQVAAAHISQYLSGTSSAAKLITAYSAAIGRTFHQRLRLSWALQPLFFRPSLASAALKTICAVPRLGYFLVQQTRNMRLIGS